MTCREIYLYCGSMNAKTKRTYTISVEADATVKRLVEEHHLATSHDALVELAIIELERRIREPDEARLWAAAASDPVFLREVEQIESEFVGCPMTLEEALSMRGAHAIAEVPADSPPH
jgi:hypothetical protein